MSSLPKTVTVLNCPNVRNTIKKVRPAVVMLELCPQRQVMLQYSEEDILKEAEDMNFTKVRLFIRRDGLIAGIMQSLFLKLSAEVTKKLGIAPGGEFRAGYEEGIKCGARILLGDRMVNVTFQRALYSLNFFQKMRFYFAIARTLTEDISITQEEVEKMKNKDMVDMLVGELAKEFPTVTKVLVDERDKVLAYSLRSAANATSTQNGPPVTVVGIVGMGHVKGIEKLWNEDIVGIQEITAIPRPSRTARVVSLAIKVGVVTVLGVASYFAIRRLRFHFR